MSATGNAGGAGERGAIVRAAVVRGAALLAAIVFAAGVEACGRPPLEPADLVIKNARIVTMDPSRPRAEAIAIRGDRILAVGSEPEIGRHLAKGTRVIEREFHDDLYGRLMADPELGGRLERGSPLALGYLDVRHDGITAELKVERGTPVTKETASKYMGQPSQYAAADGARLSILAILDMSAKRLPIGTPENYLFPLEPRCTGSTTPRRRAWFWSSS